MNHFEVEESTSQTHLADEPVVEHVWVHAALERCVDVGGVSASAGRVERHFDHGAGVRLSVGEEQHLRLPVEKKIKPLVFKKKREPLVQKKR